MGKAWRKRYRRRFYDLLMTCCSGKRPADEGEDMYIKDPTAVVEITEDDKSALLPKDENQNESKISGADDTSHDSSAASVYLNNSARNGGISHTSSENSPNEQQEATPKRPDSFIEVLISPSYQATEGRDEILQRLAVQTSKLDQILAKLQDNEGVATLRKHVDTLYSHLDPWRGSNQHIMTETPLNSRRESRCFTFPTISETREAEEHDEISGSQQQPHSTTEQSPKAFTASETTIKHPIDQSQSREPKEHDSGIKPQEEPTILATIIRDQVKQLQRCSREHLGKNANGTNEVQKMVAKMKTEVDRLNPPIRGYDESILRDKASILRTRSFVRCSYPSPIRQGNPGDTEFIELENLSTTEDFSSESNFV